MKPLPKTLPADDRALIAAFEARRAVTICPPGASSRDWAAQPYSTKELRDNTWANLLRGRRLLGARNRAAAGLQKDAA